MRCVRHTPPVTYLRFKHLPCRPMVVQQHRCRRLCFLAVYGWIARVKPSAALLVSSTSTSSMMMMLPSSPRMTMMVSGTGSRQAPVQLPSGRFAACWPVGLGQYNGGPAVFLANKRRILDPREEVLPIPIPEEAAPLLSEASEYKSSCVYSKHNAMPE